MHVHAHARDDHDARDAPAHGVTSDVRDAGAIEHERAHFHCVVLRGGDELRFDNLDLLRDAVLIFLP